MILEVVQFEIKPGLEAEFEKNYKKAMPLLKRAKGCRDVSLRRAVEKPSRYLAFLQWDTLENHTVDFRGSPDYQEFRKLIGHCFAEPPEVQHAREVSHGS